jgi:hypothetical protein
MAPVNASRRSAQANTSTPAARDPSRFLSAEKPFPCLFLSALNPNWGNAAFLLGSVTVISELIVSPIPHSLASIIVVWIANFL